MSNSKFFSKDNRVYYIRGDTSQLILSVDKTPESMEQRPILLIFSIDGNKSISCLEISDVISDISKTYTCNPSRRQVPPEEYNPSLIAKIQQLIASNENIQEQVEEISSLIEG